MGKAKVVLPIEREGIKCENPEKYYEFGDEIGCGKFAVVKQVVHKSSGKKYAAKIIKYDSESTKFAVREYDLMVGGKMDHKMLPKLHEAFLVRKYLILIMELVDGKTLLDQVASRHSLNEDEVAAIIRQLCEVLDYLHNNNIVHLDLRPTNIRFFTARDLKLLDFNSARAIANKKAGEVVDVIGDTEFCAPEMLSFDKVGPGSDMWTVGVNLYILLSGISPFYYEDEDKVVKSVQTAKWSFDEDAFANITSEAKEFIKACLKIAPEQRMTAATALTHKWLSKEYEQNRKRSTLNVQDVMKETDERLYGEEEEEYIGASCVYRTFEEEEYDSPEESDEED